MKIRLVSPPNLGSMIRGAGFYYTNLKKSLEAQGKMELVTKNEDLVHFAYFDHFFLTLPPVRTIKTVVTVFDMTPLVLADLFRPGIRGELKWQVQRNILKSVDSIITISESAKKDILKFTGISEDKVFVTYLSAGPQCQDLKLKREDFILYIGDVNANKNISSLLKALTNIPNQRLLLVGKAFLDTSLPEVKKIRSEIVELNLEKQVEFVGFVSEEQKVRLLNTAAVYCQPSIYEGFCLPVAEALACGTVVVCGSNSSLPEVAGGAAIYADVTDSRDLAEKLRTALNLKPKEKLFYRTEATKMAKMFSWERTANKTISVYDQTLG